MNDLNNPFYKMALPLQEVPKDLKPKVMADINRAKLAMEVAGLFTHSYRSIFYSFLKN